MDVVIFFNQTYIIIKMMELQWGKKNNASNDHVCGSHNAKEKYLLKNKGSIKQQA